MKATFGAGCFWHVEELFRHIKGVQNTVAGYIGGDLKNPSYQQVCTNNTGHAEAVQIEYDPGKITYKELLDVFWNNHDPTTPNRQGPDIGAQYRSVIFIHNTEQEKIAKESKTNLEKSHKFGKPIVTQIVDATEFYKAEDYHQKYFEKQGLH